MGINYYDLTYDELATFGVILDQSVFYLDFSFKYIIPTLDRSADIEDICVWCTENLSGFFKIEYHDSSFEKEIDAMAFKLRWT